MESNKIIPKGILFPFILLTTLFFAWAVPNNLTDTMLAAFKRIMSMSDSKTAWIQVVCYLFNTSLNFMLHQQRIQIFHSLSHDLIACSGYSRTRQ